MSLRAETALHFKFSDKVRRKLRQGSNPVFPDTELLNCRKMNCIAKLNVAVSKTPPKVV